MSRQQLFNLIKSRGVSTNSRNPFDLGNSHSYSQKAGKIQPLKAFHTLPDDFIKCNIGDYTQTFPMKNAPFLRGNKEIAAYYVPYNTIWHNFNQYQATREDPESSLLKDKGISFEPRIALYSLYRVALFKWIIGYIKELEYIWLTYRDDEWKDMTDTQRRQESISRYLQFLDTDFDLSTLGNTICVLLYRNDDPYFISNYGLQALDFFKRSSESFTYRDLALNVLDEVDWCDVVNKLDFLGYGNIYPLFKKTMDNIYNVVTSDMATSDARSTIYNYVYMLHRRLLQMSSNYNSPGDPGDVQLEYLSVYPLFSYNKIFYDMFRNVYYDTDYDVRNYNCDFIDGNSLAGSIIQEKDLPIRFFTLESHQWKKDIFTALMPDTQFGAVSSLVLDTQSFSASISGATNSDSHPDGASHVYSPSGGSVPNGALGVDTNGILYANDTEYPAMLRSPHIHYFSAQYQVPSSSISFDVLALKRAECLQQYRQDLLRAGNRTSDIFKQIYGSNPKSDLDESPYFIEARESQLIVDPVVATAQTGADTNGDLGSVSARAVSSQGDFNFEFSTHDFGCILFLSYIVPESMYNSTRIDPHLMNLTPEQHFIPYFQNLGFEPVTREQLNNFLLSGYRNSTVGFAPRYPEFKTDIDLAHGALCNLFLEGDLGEVLETFGYNYVGSLSHWVVTRKDMQSEFTTSLRNFYINPKILDNVFVQAAGDDYESDQFICLTNINIHSVRQLSELGLPQFC